MLVERGFATAFRVRHEFYRNSMSIQSRSALKLELLAVSDQSRSSQLLRSILLHTNWLVHWVAGRQEAMLFLRDHPVPVFVCPEELPDGSWRRLLTAAASLDNPPKVLVYSNRADRDFANEVLEAGGYDILSTPLQQDEVLRAISLASRTWRDEVRRYGYLAAAMTA